MNPSHTSRSRRPRAARGAGATLLALLSLAALAAASSGCGGSDAATTPAAGATPTAIQVMATAARGDLTESVAGPAKVTRIDGELTVVATIDAQSAASVAEGQSASVFFGRGGDMPQPGQSGMPQTAPSGMPAPGASGMPAPESGASGAPVPQGGQGAVPQGGFPGRQGGREGAEGTVTAVEMNADGTAAATISLDELPSQAKDGSTGFARIEVEVLAADVVLVPTAAVEGSGAAATVQVVAAGTAETRTITAGQQSGGMTEVVSGLEEGENVVYTQAFQGFPGGGRSGMPMPQGDGSGGSY